MKKVSLLLPILLFNISCGKIEKCDGEFTYNICRLFYEETDSASRIANLELEFMKLRAELHDLISRLEDENASLGSSYITLEESLIERIELLESLLDESEATQLYLIKEINSIREELEQWKVKKKKKK